MPISRNIFCNRLLALTAALAVLCVFANPVLARGLTDYGDWMIGQYRVVTDSTTDPQNPDFELDRLTITRGGVTLYQIAEADVAVSPGSLFGKGKYCCEQGKISPPYALGADILHVGAPNLMVLSFSGGAHCCFTLRILVLGESIREIQLVDLADFGEGQVFYDAGGNAPIMEVEDPILNYFHTPFAYSAAQGVKLSFDRAGLRFSADPNLMREPAPPQAEIDKAVESARMNTFWHQAPDMPDIWHPPIAPEMLQMMARLIYSGHIDLAREVLDRSWMLDSDSKEGVWRELTNCVLRQSHYWYALAALNGLDWSAAPTDCPPQ